MAISFEYIEKKGESIKFFIKDGQEMKPVTHEELSCISKSIDVCLKAAKIKKDLKCKLCGAGDGKIKTFSFHQNCLRVAGKGIENVL